MYFSCYSNKKDDTLYFNTHLIVRLRILLSQIDGNLSELIEKNQGTCSSPTKQKHYFENKMPKKMLSNLTMRQNSHKKVNIPSFCGVSVMSMLTTSGPD